jgi:hypothetical protein
MKQLIGNDSVHPIFGQIFEDFTRAFQIANDPRGALERKLGKKIVTSHVQPPIPVRNFDWSAHVDGEEETKVQGWGVSERDAIEDLAAELTLAERI